ncbi:Uma2 family endonuclease [Kitasatospora sp. NPDC048545]|uniref:Uma2 family endonuclease n=1 Tax=Kitasatospora sp. NPDC048545 TaxID=3157208 RepID=UPI0033C47A74
MSAAAVEEPFEQMTLLESAELISKQLPGHRVEIIGSEITVTPTPDMSHDRSVRRFDRAFNRAGLDGGETEVWQNIGIWLPDGPFDYAQPDLAITDADCDDRVLDYGAYDPAIFRLVLEVTSAALCSDLTRKSAANAMAGVPPTWSSTGSAGGCWC